MDKHHQVRRKGLNCDEEFADTNFHTAQSPNFYVLCHHNEESWSDLFSHSPVAWAMWQTLFAIQQ